MGVWGVGVFENDDAMDWLYQLLENGDITFLRNTLLILIEQKSYLEMSECCKALAAAEVVASAIGSKASVLPNQVEGWLYGKDLVEIRKLVPLAREAMKRVQSDSEINALWDSSQYSMGWFGVIRDIEARLNQI